MSNVFRTFAFLFLISLISASVSAQQNIQEKPTKGHALPVRHFAKPALQDRHAETLLFKEDFESGASGWTTRGDWAVGRPSGGPGSGFESSSCGSTNRSGVYRNNADDWLISPTILLSVPSRSTKIILRYKEWFELESGYDRGSLKLSTDDGETWSTLSSKDGSSDWREQQIDLSAFANKKIRLAFQFSSDSSTAFQGWYVDNIQLVSFDAQPFNISMTSLNSQNFPFVYMNVAADSSGVGLNSLTQSSFSVFENTTLQTDYFQVTPPNVGGGVRLVDVVFLLDVTSSMTDYIENVRTNMLNFMNALSISGINFGVGFVVFGDITYTYNGRTWHRER
jgi:hypothetical protein